MKSIFEEGSYNELVSRLEKLTKDHKPKKGKMKVEQMLVHSRKIVELAMGDIRLESKYPLKLFLSLFNKSSLYNDKSLNKHLSTIKEFISNNHDTFGEEQKRLKKMITRMHSAERFFYPYTAHPTYGRLEPHMWGQSIYKNLDHHFKKFGV